MGKLIAVEGIDGVGKSTQVAALGNLMRLMTGRVAEMRFPVRTGITGAMLDAQLTRRQHMPGEPPELMHLLFVANRWEMKRTIDEYLEDGNIVIADRYVDSGVAYSAAQGLDRNWCKVTNAGLPVPDITVYLNSGGKMLYRNQRGGAPELYERDEEFQMRVHHEFLKLFEQRRHLNEKEGTSTAAVIMIDATMPAQKVTQRIYEKLQSSYSCGF